VSAYQEALAFLFPRTTTIKFGLERTEALLASVGDPHQVLATIHVGGTNGKGSAAALVANALREAGWRVGLYTSPHLVSFRERIVVDGEPITEAAVTMWTAQLRPLIEELEATFFEVSTVMALADFVSRGAEIAVIEVGLGGRLDSTNVIRPLVSGVTKIAIDHQKYLGRTLAKIAAEKAWIAKPGVPFVIGERRPELVEVLRREAGQAVRSLDPAGQLDFRVMPAGYLWEGPLGLDGPHQRRNAAVAHGILAALPERFRPDLAAIQSGFGRTKVPGRLDRRGRWLFDVAHNPDGMRSLTASLAALRPPRPIHALVSILGDKAWTEMLVELDRTIDRGILTVAPTATGRRWSLRWLERWLARADRPPARAQWSLIPDFREALAQVQEGAGTMLVTGSFHTVGDTMELLGLGPV